MGISENIQQGHQGQTIRQMTEYQISDIRWLPALVGTQLFLEPLGGLLQNDVSILS